MTGIVPFLIFAVLGLGLLVAYALLGEVLKRRNRSDDPPEG